MRFTQVVFVGIIGRTKAGGTAGLLIDPVPDHGLIVEWDGVFYIGKV